MTHAELEHLDAYQERLEQEKYFEQLAIDAAAKEDAAADCLKEKQMTAKEMFEKIGMDKYQSDDWIEYRNKTYTMCVAFYLNVKELGCHIVITPDLYEAIAQQMKELGWIE